MTTIDKIGIVIIAIVVIIATFMLERKNGVDGFRGGGGGGRGMMGGIGGIGGIGRRGFGVRRGLGWGRGGANLIQTSNVYYPNAASGVYLPLPLLRYIHDNIFH